MLRRFKPAWWSVLVSGVCLGLFIKLGAWQWARGDEKAALLKAHEISRNIKDLTQGIDIQSGDKISLDGQFDNQHTFLLDNQFYHHQVGFDVLTPFKHKSGAWVLIDRGWVQANPNRGDLPAIRLLNGTYQFTGKAYVPSAKARVLSERLDNEGQWPLIIEKMTLDNLSKRLGLTLLPFVIRLDKNASFGYIRDWQVVSMSPERHYAYAVQWFSFALIVLFLFVYFNLENKKRGSQ